MNKTQQYNLLLNGLAFIIAVIAAYFWTEGFSSVTYIDYSSYVPFTHIVGALAMMVAIWSILELLLARYQKIWGFIFNVVCILSILLPLGHTLPLEVETPELFPLWMIPMHFFAPLFLFAVQAWKK